MRDGGRWHVQPTSDPKGTPYAELKDVACPSADRCLAVGSYAVGSDSRALIESWDGADWKIVSVPFPAGSDLERAPDDRLRRARPVSRGGQLPVGVADRTAYSALWDGASWTVVPTPASGPRSP